MDCKIKNGNILFWSLLICLSSPGQKSKEKVAPTANNYTAYFIKLSAPKIKITPAINLTDVMVYDARFDTINTGFIEHVNLSREKLIQFTKPTSQSIKEFFQSQINFGLPDGNAPSYKLVCFIKKLFLSDHIYMDKNGRPGATELDYEINSGVIALFEFYASTGEQYIPIYRFDSIMTGAKDIYRNAREYLESILTASLQKLERVNPERIMNSTQQKSLTSIHSYNNSRFSIPILQNTPRKGLYPNFENFKNNAPIDTPFTVDKSSKGDFLYLKNQKGEDILQTELWGYSDGKDMYIFSAENYFRLERQGHTFIIFGAKDYTTARNFRLNFGLLDVAMPNSNYSKRKTYTSYSLELKLHQLDMESGELY